MSPIEYLKNFYENLKKTKFYYPAIFLLVTGLDILRVYTLFTPEFFCFGSIFMIGVTFGIPYFLGWRDVKILVIFSLLAILITGLFAGYLIGDAYWKSEKSFESKDGILYDGHVTPFRGNPGEAYTYTVKVNSSKNITNFTILAVYLIYSADGINWQNLSLNTTDNITYTGTVYLTEKKIYLHYFTAAYSAENNTVNWTIPNTQMAETNKEELSKYIRLGPITTTYAEIAMNSILTTIVWLCIQIGFAVFLLILVVWWVNRAKKERSAREIKREEVLGKDKTKEQLTKEDFECSKCGALVKEKDTFCWRCGEVFEEKAQGPEDKEIKESKNVDVPNDERKMDKSS